MSDAAGSRRDRWRAAIVLAVFAGAFATWRNVLGSDARSDLDQLWFAARALVHGLDPYGVIGPGRPFDQPWPLYYPPTAIVLVVPFAWMPIAIARVAFAVVTTGALGWAMGNRLRTLWPMVFSAAFLITVARNQWSPVLLAAAWSPWLLLAASAKPNIGAAMVVPHLNRRWAALAAVIAFPLLALVAYALPGVIALLRSHLSLQQYLHAPIMRPWGILLLLAALRWRRPDARLLLAMACVPHTPSLYDVVPLFFLCRTFREALWLSVLTHVLFITIIALGPFDVFDSYAERLGRLAVFVVYLPLLVIVLRRPNRNVDIEVDGPGARSLALPSTRWELALLGLLAIGAFMLVWLPFLGRA